MSITNTKQPEALRLADAIGRHAIVNGAPNTILSTDELRRLHAAIARENGGAK
jgi:hypothetical protein